jgi:hypothetical protein
MMMKQAWPKSATGPTAPFHKYDRVDWTIPLPPSKKKKKTAKDSYPKLIASVLWMRQHEDRAECLAARYFGADLLLQAGNGKVKIHGNKETCLLRKTRMLSVKDIHER